MLQASLRDEAVLGCSDDNFSKWGRHYLRCLPMMLRAERKSNFRDAASRLSAETPRRVSMPSSSPTPTPTPTPTLPLPLPPTTPHPLAPTPTLEQGREALFESLSNEADLLALKAPHPNPNPNPNY